MNTDMILKMHSTASRDTELLAKKIGNRLKGGEVIELLSDLGGGKTTFVRGLVEGSGSHDHVASPTYTISRNYSAPKFNIHHFDFYRLQEAGLIGPELEEVLNDSSGVVVVEWAEVVRHVLPEERVAIKISLLENDERDITIKYPESMKYLFEDLEASR